MVTHERVPPFFTFSCDLVLAKKLSALRTAVGDFKLRIDTLSIIPLFFLFCSTRFKMIPTKFHQKEWDTCRLDMFF